MKRPHLLAILAGMALGLPGGVLAQEPIKPSMLIIFDTSGSMTWTSAGLRTYGDGSVDYPGRDRDGNGLPDDSRMFILKEALANALWGTSEIQFGLMRYHQEQGYRINRSPDHYEDGVVLNYDGSNSCEGGDVLVPMAEGSTLSILGWIDQTEDFQGGDFELRADGATPIGGSLYDARDYFRDHVIGQDEWNECRSYYVLLLTDGEETCGGDPDRAARALRAVSVGGTSYDVKTFVIGLGDDTNGSETLNEIAEDGGTGQAFFARDPTTLQVALNQIIQLAIPHEECNGLDDDCNGLIDDGLFRPCSSACGPGSETCRNGAWVECNAPPVLAEACDGEDNDCDGAIDENLTRPCSTICGAGIETCNDARWLGCTAPQPQPEVCDGEDNDCDGLIDEEITQPCATACGAGVIACVAGSWGECTAPQPQPETCDGLDSDCDGAVDEDLTRPCANDCGSGIETCYQGAWVNCTAPTGLPEVCDGLDNDCDGAIDEHLTRPCHGPCGEGIETCAGGYWQGCTAPQPSPEACDGLDNDCDGAIDEYLTRPCSTACGAGVQTCLNAQWQACTAPLPQVEVCDGSDNDCDGAIDENLTRECSTACGRGMEMCIAGSWVNCTAPLPQTEVCDGADNDCDGLVDEDVILLCSTPCGQGSMVCTAGSWGECSAAQPEAEVCDNQDNDCDGAVDEGMTRPCLNDCGPGTETCVAGQWIDCTAPNALPEICDNIDNDCDGSIDENLTRPCSSPCGPGTETCRAGRWQGCTATAPTPELCDGEDNDCDGSIDEHLTRPCSTVCGAGTEACLSAQWQGCNAPEPSPEVCDGLDNNCDGLVDNDLTRECQSACGVGQEMCIQGAWLNCTAPSPREEVCDGVDNDCDGELDEDLTRPCFSLCGEGTEVCAEGQWGECSAPLPAAEACDGLDNDCDGLIDEDLMRSCANACGPGTEVCLQGNWTNCTAPLAAAEICDGLDNDCDGLVDEGISRPCTSPCGPGVEACVAGLWQRCDAPSPEPERCDGLDNDCDGAMDEDLSRPCSTICGAGTETCQNAQWAGCTAPTPSPEVCDGYDNDCDGLVDQDLTRSCLSECGVGKEVCLQGAWVNCTAPSPHEEVCDGLDNDCDGQIDEDLTRPCQSVCGMGEETCHQGTWGECVAPPPEEEICDGLDNDCDGLVDEGLVRPCEGLCGPGTETCLLGVWGDCLEPPPGPELCDGYDNDCDGLIDEDLLRDCTTVCGAGAQECVDSHWGPCSAPQPQAEICDDLDNDCDGKVDEGLERPCSTACGQGSQTCHHGEWASCSATSPREEACDNLDNDCDGLVDEGLIETCFSPCGEGIKTCQLGHWSACIAPEPSPEACDCLDNDCDGEIDEGNPCEAGRTCLFCECALPCAMGECPVGFNCIEDHCITDPCYRVFCGEGRTCQDGECVDPACQGVECEGDLVCDRGDCVPPDCTIVGCPAGEICRERACVPDPCFGVSCDEGYFCRDGLCIFSCAQVICPSGQVCRDGECYPDPCAEVVCNEGLVCEAGLCVVDLCLDVTCQRGTICLDGECLDDPCLSIICPPGQVCEAGQCLADPQGEGDAGLPDPLDGSMDLPSPGPGPDRDDTTTKVSSESGCGCSLAERAGPRPWGLSLVLICLILGLARRRLRATDLMMAKSLLIAILLLLAGCGDDTTANPHPDAGPPAEDHCLMGWISPETCDGKDNDCDGEIDEDFDIMTDPVNCGGCGRVCALENAVAGCAEGSCTVSRCAVGWRDDNGFGKDGCEARCSDDSADEICDGIDNDCDGIVDNGFDTRIDPQNCGGCGRACSFAHGEALCVMGLCSLGACEAGYVDLDKDPSNGCESPCVESQGGVELCDGEDNNCNGQVDEGYDLASDPANCGSCNHRCALPNTVMACAGGSCTIVGCEPGFSNQDGREANGCEAACEAAVPELCDEQDNDCDGLVDEDFDLSTDRRNCGSCGTLCAFANAIAACEHGLCVIAGCEAGFSNADGLADNGCEALCEVSNGGVEACDLEDNDCDGQIDEDFDLVNDVLHCGACQNACARPNSVMVCKIGHCAVLRCEAGYTDADKQPDNGCEYPCQVSNDGVEACDEVDNDCDGKVDEGFDLNHDPNNCASCGNVCQLDHANATCIDRACAILSCLDGYFDANGRPEDGCEYSCTPSNEGLELCDGVDNDCDGQVDEGYDLSTDRNNCGDCGRSCALPNATVDCRSSECHLVACREGFVDLNEDSLDGCEYLCTVSNDGAEICDDLDNDCNGVVDDGYDLMNDSHNCGVCGRLCQLAHASSYCLEGECQIESCQPGYVDLDGNPATGCELPCVPTGEELCDGLDNDCNGLVDEDFDLENDPGHCGVCGQVCSLPQAVEGCSFGLCVVDHCEPGFTDADRRPDNGCEYPCLVSNGAVEICDGLDNDCDGFVDEEFHLDRDPQNCGVCGHVCALSNANALCIDGLCAIMSCQAGFSDANRDPSDGCEYPCVITNQGLEICDEMDNDCDGLEDEGFDLTTDINNCGACGYNCAVANAEVACEASECRTVRCFEGFVDLNGNPEDGCEHLCTPSNGGVEICDYQDNNCDGHVDEGIDLMTDLQNCGGCGWACHLPHAESLCEGGICQIVYCHQGYFDMDGSATTGCEALCVVTGEEVCDGLDNDCNGMVDETFDTMADPAHCGGCNQACHLTHAVAGCHLGSCVVDHCLPGYIDADRLADNGCEYPCFITNGGVEICDDLDNDCNGFVDEGFLLGWDPENCGSCGHSCDLQHATALCIEGECTILACLPGFSDANGEAQDGCEYPCFITNQGLEACDQTDNDCDGQVDEGFDLTSDTNHCGACGRSCAVPNTEVACQGGQCAVVRCHEGFVDLNGQAGDGCEHLCTPTNGGLEICDYLDNDCDGQVDEGFDTMSDPANCGICGRPCQLPHATALCVLGACLIDSCAAGYRDLDGSPLTGCEASCQATGPEECDGLDNDCDGLVDEDFDLLNDENHCGFCNNPCTDLANAQTYCNSGQCDILGCLTGYRNLNQDISDGCECALLNGGVEACNGIDDDCSGVVDDHLGGPPLGFHCLILGVCEGVWPHCTGGEWVCGYPSSYQEGEESLCDGLDNDCDGLVDEAFPDLEAPCGAGYGVCRGSGQWICNQSGDGLVCTAQEHPEMALPEICDGLDNDCDGEVDEGSDEMVLMEGPGGPYLIYKYEASRPDATDTDSGTSFARSCSKGGVLPWNNVDYWTASQACQDAGHRLCTEEEWMAACQGEGENAYPYGNTYIATFCNGLDYGAGTLLPTGDLASCVTPDGGIHDLSGNVWEWVLDEIVSGAFAFHGGAYENLSGGLTCTYRNAAGGEANRPNIGFRCCDDP